ncbi:MAG TPA: peptidoglycan DD-metalloendopeptidase family protein [Gaiellaceae bacterium]|nr:peptidoglycan DD-metalloendopeptidase family protein [Gaiellaceae bacterium]
MARRLAILAVGCLVLAAPAAGDSGHSLGEVQAKLSAARQKEARLQQQIGDLTSSIRQLEAHVGDVSRRLSVLEQDLALHQRRLDKLNALYDFETERLTFLRRAYATALHELNLRMIDLYETHDPTLVELILESNSFQDALDRIHYLDSIAQQDKHIAAKVAVARNEMRVTREQTKAVRTRVHAETQVIAVRTQQQRDVRNQLLASTRRLSGKRASQQTALKLTRKQERTLQTEAQAIAAADAQVRSRLAAVQGATDATPSASGLIWPVSGPVVSPFGYRWGRLHAGIDIAVTYGTPIHAAAAGTVVLAGWVSGYGNYTCIDHGGGMATCYAHQSSYAVSQGASVAQGQVIGYVGCTGHCFGPHLHFEVRINGTPVDPLGYL